MLILKEPDLGTALVLLPVAVVLGATWRQSVETCRGDCIARRDSASGRLAFHEPFQKHRVDLAAGGGISRRPATRSSNRRSPLGQAGKGLGRGSQNQGSFVPIAYSDLLSAALAEETGFISILSALTLYMALLLRLVHNATRAGSLRMYLVMGVAAVFWGFTFWSTRPW